MTSWFPPPSRPRPVEGGLKARSTRGQIAQTWWSHRFVAVLEDIGVGGRMQRGRNYARRGQVISLDVAAGAVTALVQGSRVEPYRVGVGIATFGDQEWAALERALAASAWYSAKMLSGEMPENIEEVFAAEGLPLFPAAAGELSMDCSCPDWSVPCKHIAAVFYLLAESFDEDPFRILAWRGRDRADLLANLEAIRADDPAAAGVGGRSPAPLAERLDSWFAMAGDLVPPAPPAASGRTVLSQLPQLGLTIGGRSLTELLEPAYERFQR